jgi:hypothetical protein
MADMKFVDGLFIKPPHQNAPDFVKFAISMKVPELLTWLNEQQGEWVNLDVKESREGKMYASVNTFEPKPQGERNNNQQDNGAPETQQSNPPKDDFLDDIPF